MFPPIFPDSRNWFRSAIEQLVYNNREKTRDAFSRLFTHFAQRTTGGFDSVGAAIELRQHVSITIKKLMSELLPPNYKYGKYLQTKMFVI